MVSTASASTPAFSSTPDLRSASVNPATKESASKTRMGTSQKAWFKQELLNARDAGFAASEGFELIANIDSDTIVPSGWLDTVLGEFARDPKLVCLSGPYVYYDMAAHNRLMIDMFYVLTYLIYLLNRFVLKVGSVVQGGNFVFKRDAWVQVGGYDRSIEFFGEDTDVAVRLSKVGGVKWTYALKMKTSGRRLEAEGVFRTAATYTLNYFWVTFRGKPATMEYKDVRKD